MSYSHNDAADVRQAENDSQPKGAAPENRAPKGTPDKQYNTILPQTALVADVNLVGSFLRDYVSRAVQLVAIHPDNRNVVARHFGEDTSAATKWAVDWNASGYGIYWSVNEVAPNTHKKAG